MKRLWTTATLLAALTVASACHKPNSTTVALNDSTTVIPLGDTALTVTTDSPKVSPPPAAAPARTAPPPAPPPAAPPPPPPSTSTPVSHAPARAGVPSGTTITTAAMDSINSASTQVGDVIRVRVTSNVSAHDKVIIPRGSIVTLAVNEIAGAGGSGKKGSLSLRAQDVEINGHSYPISAHATDYEYEMKSHGIGASEVAKTGAGAALGAILGHVIGGKTGTIIGAVGGGAAGAVVASKGIDHDLVVHPGAAVTLTLTDPFRLSSSE